MTPVSVLQEQPDGEFEALTWLPYPTRDVFSLIRRNEGWLESDRMLFINGSDLIQLAATSEEAPPVRDWLREAQ